MPIDRQQLVRSAEAFSVLAVSWFVAALVLTVPFQLLHQISGAPDGLRGPFAIALSLVVAIVAARLLWLRLDARRQALEASRPSTATTEESPAAESRPADVAPSRSWTAPTTDRTRAGP